MKSSSALHRNRALGQRAPVIWVVDDSPTQAAFAQRALGEPYRYEHFIDGESMVARVASKDGELPDLVLLDWVMPGLSGDETCRQVRSTEKGRELPIIILTASRTDTSDIVNALDSGANDYLSKPFAPEELRARVGALLRTAQLQREANRERQRLIAMNELASALLHGRRDVRQVLDDVARWLVESLCDGCVLVVTHDHNPDIVVTRHTDHEAAPLLAGFAEVPTGLQAFADAIAARAALPPDTHPYIERIGVRAVASRTFTSERLARWSAVLVRDRGSEPFDDSDRLAIAAALEYSGIALEAALRSENERATTRFHEEMLGIVSHDLRTPLGAIDLGVQILRNEHVSENAARVLERLDRSSKRMTSIVDQLLDVTRARLGTGIPVSVDRVALRASIERVVDELRMSKPDAVFEIHGAELLGEWDPARLEQVIANLAGNAVQYGKSGSPITIRISSAANVAHIEVHNENRGDPIGEELLSTIFDPFKRGQSAGNTSGLGLGLYIVFQIVKAHRGAISVSSDASGTRFRVTLPRHRSD